MIKLAIEIPPRFDNSMFFFGKTGSDILNIDFLAQSKLKLLSFADENCFKITQQIT